MPSVTIRTDASHTIGTGHVMRCLTLATELRAAGSDVAFVCRAHEGHLCDLIEARGFPVTTLPVMDTASASPGEPAHASWLGARWPDDAEQTRRAIDARGGSSDWLIVDHYALDARWEAALRESARRVAVIDDLADRDHDCDVLLDQNLVDRMHVRYSARVPEHCSALLGPHYALLDRSYGTARASIDRGPGPVRRVFVFFGADPQNVTGQALAALIATRSSGVEVDVVVAKNAVNEHVVRAQARGHPDIRVHTGLPTLAPLMAAADMAIGASGSSTWERMCVGLPAIVVSTAENQRPIAAELHRRGLIRWLGDITDVTAEDFRSAVAASLAQGVDIELSRRCMAVVDGRGAARVRAAIQLAELTPLTLRDVRTDDERLLLEWANDPDTRLNSFSAAPIGPETHRGWFQARLAAGPRCRLFIAEDDRGRPVGQIRFDAENDAWRINYSLARDFRGRGLGRRLLEVGIRRLRRSTGDGRVRFIAAVKPSNLPSRRVFDSLGFEARTVGDFVEYHRDG